jgi:hypothetical protein
MKKKALAYLLATLTGFCAQQPAFAQVPEMVRTATLIALFDLDGGAASATAVHSADAITDAASFTIDAQPDIPRPLTATLTDGDTSISACTLTVVGTQADGTVITSTATLTGGSGAKALSPSYNFATVTSSSVGTCTGEGGGDTVSLGTTSTIPSQYVIPRGTSIVDSQGVIRYNPFAGRAGTARVKTSGSSATVASNTASAGALGLVAVNDLLLFNVKGQLLERLVTAKADADSVTVNSAIDLSAGYSYTYKRRYFGPDTEDGWISVAGFSGVAFLVDVDQMNGTGGITTSAECRIAGPLAIVHQVGTDNITAAGSKVYTVDLRLAAYDQCRIGIRWATNDDGSDTGSAQEQVSVAFAGSR